MISAAIQQPAPAPGALVSWGSKNGGAAFPTECRTYMEIADRKGWSDAAKYLLDRQALVRDDLYLAADDDEIRAFCDRKAKECQKLQSQYPTMVGALLQCSAILDTYGMDWPAPSSPITGPGVDLAPLVRRLCCAKWWRRRVRVLQAREVDQYTRKRGQVAKYRQVYVCDWVVKQRRQAEKRNRETLSQTVATNDHGQEYTLAELSDLGVSNMANRRHELMARMRGFEEVATSRGHVGEFWTFTTASRWHAMRWIKKARKAVPNSKYEGTTPRQAQDQLCRLWSRIRADFDRAGLGVYGFRVVEPHHDGTPHWHLLLFMAPEHVRLARKICRRHLLSDNGKEAGAWRSRFDRKAIDPAKGTAAGYIAKYVAKNLDGAGLNLMDDDSGLSMGQGAERVRAWASGWGIRQFQQIGGPSVTVWRELRKLWSHGEPGTDDLFGNAAVEAAGEAADAGDWAAFVEFMGGPLVDREKRPARPGYWLEGLEQMDPETGELMPATTAYGDQAKGQVFGLWIKRGGAVLTRFYRWTIEHRRPPAPAQPEPRPIEALTGQSVAPEWFHHLAGYITGADLSARWWEAFAPQRGALDLCQ